MILSEVFGADIREFLQESGVAALDGHGDFIQRPDEAFQRPHKAHARHGGEGFKKLPVERVEEPHQLGSQVTAAQAAIDVIDRVKGQGIAALAFRRGAKARRDPRGHEDFVANRLHSNQQRMALNAVVENFTGYFGDHVGGPWSFVRGPLSVARIKTKLENRNSKLGR